MSIITIDDEKSNKILHKKSASIKNFHIPEITILFQQIILTVQKPGAAGLAAPQLGKNFRVFALHIDKTKPPLFFCNPRVLDVSQETYLAQEGCLSVPGKSAEVERHKSISLSWQDIRGDKYDETGQKLTYTFDGFWAHAIQHELDHLNGILCVDKAHKIWDNEL